MLGYLLAQDWVLPLIKKGDVAHIEFLSTTAAVLILLLAGLLALVVLLPRRRRTGTGGVVSWTAISSYPSASDYLATLITHSAEELASARVAHCYDIARVCWRKQKWAGRSLLTSGLGSLLAVLCVLLNA